MDPEQLSARAIRYAKRQKLNDEAERSGNSAADTLNSAEVAAIEQTGDIFKLDIDCYEEAFDYLPFNDLVNVGKTCKRLQQVAGYCYQQNYSGRACFSSDAVNYRGIDIKHFAPFIQKLSIGGDDDFQRFIDSQSEFKRLKQIELSCLKTAGMNRLKQIALNRVEILCVWNCELSNNFREIIDKCVKLKHLEIQWCDGEFNWFASTYPTLEYFKIVPRWLEDAQGFLVFLELNPNIRKFATTIELLWTHHDAIMTSNVKLDDLAIKVDDDDIDEFRLQCDCLNELHERGFYKQMQLYFTDTARQEDIDRLAALNGLNKLYVDVNKDPLAFSALKSLEELFWFDANYVTDLKIVANNLTNLKRIHFGEASTDDIMSFIRRSVEMHRIRVNQLRSGVHFNEDTKVIDLRALNSEREQLPDADKITLYVQEEVYLATKWALDEIDFGLIRLKRAKSFDSNRDFSEYQ